MQDANYVTANQKVHTLLHLFLKLGPDSKVLPCGIVSPGKSTDIKPKSKAHATREGYSNDGSRFTPAYECESLTHSPRALSIRKNSRRKNTRIIAFQGVLHFPFFWPRFITLRALTWGGVSALFRLFFRTENIIKATQRTGSSSAKRKYRDEIKNLIRTRIIFEPVNCFYWVSVGEGIFPARTHRCSGRGKSKMARTAYTKWLVWAWGGGSQRVQNPWWGSVPRRFGREIE